MKMKLSKLIGFSAIILCIICLSACGNEPAEGQNNKDTQTIQSQTVSDTSATQDETDSSENVTSTDPPVVDGSMPEMQIADGFSVLSTENLSILVTEDHSKKMHVARVAALKNENGEQALYFDALSNDNKILSSIMWRGYYQLFVNNDGLLILMRISVSPTTQRGTAIYQLYEVSDSKISGYDVVELETPQINAVAGKGKTINFTVGSPAATAMYEGLFLDFSYTFRDELKKRSR